MEVCIFLLKLYHKRNSNINKIIITLINPKYYNLKRNLYKILKLKRAMNILK